MSRPPLNLQDNFINQVRRENLEITIVLLDGSQLLGKVKGFDNFTVVVSSANGGEHLIYKHAIAQMVSAKPLVTVPPPRPERRPDSRPDNRGGGDRGPRRDNRGGGGDNRGPRPPRQDRGGEAAPQGGGAPASSGPGGGDSEPKPRGEGGGSGFNKLDLSALKDGGEQQGS